MRYPVGILLVLSMLLLSACAGNKAQYVHVPGQQSEQSSSVTQQAEQESFDEFDDPAIADTHIADPFEPWNRMWFHFNDFLLLQVLKPLHAGYSAITPKDMRTGLSNAANNLQAPIRIVNSVLQGEFAQAVVEFGRFLVNSTAGIGGLAVIVPEEDALVPINLRNANFGGTLATWGVGEGFYLVWPLFGPSTARDTVGIVGDTVAYPLFWASEPRGGLDPLVAFSISGGLRFNSIDQTIKAYEALTKSALEPYVAVREAYVNSRRGQMMHRMPVW